MGKALIDGVLLTPQKRIPNPKGDILHALKQTGQGYVGFGEAYFSIVHHNVIKGWKRHHRVTLNLVVPVGTIRFVLHDDRDDSYSHGKFNDFTLGEDNYARLTVPAGVWVAFMGVGDGLNLLLNIANEEHDPTEADNIDLHDLSFAW